MSKTAGSDDAFVAFVFAIVSVVALCMFLLLIWSGLSQAWARLRGTKRRDRDKNDDPAELQAGFDDLAFVWQCAAQCWNDPEMAISAARSLLFTFPRTTVTILFPRLLRFCVRPRIFVAILWAMLFSSMLYSSLTYDPYGVLGLAAGAPVADVKKAYRALATINHPDRNKTVEAKRIFPQVQRAYKAILNKDSTNPDVNEEFSVGIALPSFLVSGEHDALKFVVFVGVLVAVPALVYYYLMRGSSRSTLSSPMRTRAAPETWWWSCRFASAPWRTPRRNSSRRPAPCCSSSSRLATRPKRVT